MIKKKLHDIWPLLLCIFESFFDHCHHINWLLQKILSLFPKVWVSYLVVLELISLLWFIKDLYHYHYSAQFHITAVKLNGFPLFFKVGQGAKLSSLLFTFFHKWKEKCFNSS